MLPQNVNKEFNKVSKRVLVAVSLLGASALFFGNKSAVWGIIIGGTMAIINFRLIALSTVQALELTNPSEARVKTTLKFLLRSFMTIGVMYVAFTNQWLNFPALVLGLLMVKYTILFEAIYISARKNLIDFFEKQKLKYERGDNT